jgi:hypothetical protein
VFGLIPFGVVLGIPAALGLAPVNVVGLFGAMIACMLARGFLARTAPVRARSPYGMSPSYGMYSSPSAIWTNTSMGWFVVVCWCALALPLNVGTFDLGQVLAVQAALGPAPFSLGPGVSVSILIAFVVGLVAASAWSASLPSIGRPDEPANQAIDIAARWGESALAGSIVAGTTWGPSLGALVRGPIDTQSLLLALVSFVITCGAVAAVSYGRRFASQITNPAVLSGAGFVALAAMLMAAFVR